LFLAIAMLFINNIRVKGLYINYSKELKLLRFINLYLSIYKTQIKPWIRLKELKLLLNLNYNFATII